MLRRYCQRAVGVSLSNDEVLATTGGSEAVQFALLACANPGDDVLVIEPYYTNYAAFAMMAGVRLPPITAKAEDGFHLPPRQAWESPHAPDPRRHPLQPQQPHRHRLHPPGGGGGAVLPRPRLFLIADEPIASSPTTTASP